MIETREMSRHHTSASTVQAGKWAQKPMRSEEQLAVINWCVGGQDGTRGVILRAEFV
jgi:hypothetical protein